MGEQGLNRREFMVKTGLGLLTAGLGTGPVRKAGGEISKSPRILYRTLGRTGLKIPLVSLGVNVDSPDLIMKALDMGIKYLDTAHVQMGGNSEKIIGKVLEERKCRDDVYIATKAIFNRDHDKRIYLTEGQGKYPGATEENLNRSLSISLKRLRTDYVDIFYLHECYGPLMPLYEPLMKAMVKIKESGKARFIGVATHKDEPETIYAAVEAGIWDVALISYNFLQKNKEELKKAVKYGAEKGMGIVAIKTLAGSLLKEDVEVNHGAALKWVLNDENVCTAALGITSFEQLYSDFDVMRDITLSDKEKRDLKISSMVGGHFYCQQCSACIPSCPKKVEIPTLMRAYMYAKGYGNVSQASFTVDELPQERSLPSCETCPTCTAVCHNGIDISERLDYLISMNRSKKVLA